MYLISSYVAVAYGST